MLAQAKIKAEPSPAPSRVPTNIFTLNCELCHGGHHEDKIILCDKCDRGCHMFCLCPPLETIPDGDWVCPLCRYVPSRWQEYCRYFLCDAG